MIATLNNLLHSYRKANPPPCPQKELLVFGIKRCGNHAIIEHLLGHLANSIPSYAMTYPRHFRIHLNNTSTLPAKLLANPLYGSTQIISWENRYEVLESPEYFWPKLPTRPNVHQRPIVVLRDPYNWFASLRRKRREWRELEEDYISLWIAYARQFFIEKVDGVFSCNFNKWFVNSDYRRELSLFIGENPTETGVNRVRSIGSSFDGRKYDGRASEMKVLERWKSLTREDWAILNRYPEISELSKEIFNFLPEQ